jgi:ABC-type branched-subunit amino acid transport system substrate-binding protein
MNDRTMLRWRWLCAGMLALVVCTAQAQPALRIGQSGGFTGGQAAYAADVRAGIEAAFAGANAAGGIGGRRVELVALDDGGKREAVLANTRRLVEEERVLALIAYTSGAGTEGSLDYIGAQRVPLVGPATGNMAIRARHNPLLFHVRAGYDVEMEKIVGHVVGLGLKPRVALAYLADVGPASLNAMQQALERHRLDAVATVGLDRNAQDFGPQIAQLHAARPDLLVFISNAPPIAAIVRGLRQRGWHGQVATSSFAGARVVGDLKEHAQGLILIQVLPQPQREVLRFDREFHADLRRLAVPPRPNYTVLEGYVAGRTLVEALRRAGPGANRETLAAALSGLGELDFSGYRVRFNRGNHEGSRYAVLSVVTESGTVRY